MMIFVSYETNFLFPIGNGVDSTKIAQITAFWQGLCIQMGTN